MKRNRKTLIGFTGAGLALVLIAGIGFASLFSLSALPEPSDLETRLATGAKRWFVARGARSASLPEVDEADSAERGALIYGASCSFCHGIDGQRPVDVGTWMYPRAPILDNSVVRQWTDPELFWIIRNGIRLTGMPGFAEIHSDEEVMAVVQYLRSQEERAGTER